MTIYLILYSTSYTQLFIMNYLTSYSYKIIGINSRFRTYSVTEIQNNGD